MKGYIILLILMILPVVPTSALIVNLASTNFTTLIGSNYEISANITNNHNFVIYNVSLNPTNDIRFTQIQKIDPNQTIYSKLIVNSSSEYSKYIDMRFTFVYLENRTISPNSSSVNVTSSGFTPNYLEIYKGSEISFNNKDTLIHRIQEIGGSYDTGDISPSSSFSSVFNEIKNFSVRDYYTGYTMNIKVLGNVQQMYTYNPSYDAFLSIYVSSSRNATSLSNVLIDNTFTIPIYGSGEGLINIKNNGIEKAYGIHLSGEWLSFAKNDFNLDPGQNTYVVFTIVPIVQTTNQTNITYTKQVIIKGTNTQEYKEAVTVNVPYASLGDSVTNPGWWTEKKIFCEAFPTSSLCISEPLLEYRNITIYEPEPFNVTYTAKDVQSIKTDFAEMKTGMNFIKEGQANAINLFQEMTQSYQNLTSFVSGLNENYQNLKNTVWITFSFLFLGFLTVVMLVLILRAIKIKRIRRYYQA